MSCPLDPSTGRFVSTATPEEDATIRELYVETGLSIRQIGRHLERGNTFVKRRLKTMEIEMRPRGGGHPQHFNMDHRVVNLTLGLYKRGWSMNEIAKAMGCCGATIHYRLHMAGAEVRTRSEAHRLRHQRRRERDAEREATSTRYPPTALAA